MPVIIARRGLLVAILSDLSSRLLIVIALFQDNTDFPGLEDPGMSSVRRRAAIASTRGAV